MRRSAHAPLLIVLQVVRISSCEIFFVDNLLNSKTIILLDLAAKYAVILHAIPQDNC